VGLTVLGGIVGPLCLVQGLSLLSAGSASLLLNLEAVFTMLIAVLIGREHLSCNGLIAAALIVAGAVFLSEGSLGGTTVQGRLLIGATCLAWGIDNNLSQRMSLRNPLQISLLKALGASVPMVLLSMGLGQRFPAGPTLRAALAIGAVGDGLSIWLDLLGLREPGAAREAVVFATAPFVGVVFAVLVLPEDFTIPQALASLLMVVGVGVLLRRITPTGTTTQPCGMRTGITTARPAAIPITTTTTGRTSCRRGPGGASGMPMSICMGRSITGHTGAVLWLSACLLCCCGKQGIS
jgi:drug/metabolite transporter (DMT)-like permease